MNSNINQAFIFAAGRGERMRPLTDSIPKPLAKINDKSIIDYCLEKLLTKEEIKKIIVNGFYLSDKVFEHLKNFNDSRIVFSKEVEKIETGGGLLFAKDKIDFNKPLLTINGDVFWQAKNDDIKLLENKFAEYGCDIILGLKKIDDYFGFDGEVGDFSLGKNGDLSKIGELNYAYVGLSIINPKILLSDFVVEFGKCFSMSKIFKALTDENSMLRNVKGVELEDEYYHIGDIYSLEKINSIIK